MTYEPKNYDHLKGGAMKGFSDSQLDLHFTLYKGYLTKLNEIEEKLVVANNTKPNYSFNEYSELKRRVDCRIRRPAYINAFLEHVKWSEVSKRFSEVKISERSRRHQ